MAGDETSLGTMTTCSLTFNENATLELKLNSSTGQSDLFTVTGVLSLSDTQLVIDDLHSGFFAAGTTLVLISYGDGMADGLGTGSDIFWYNGQALTEGSIFTANGNTYQINYAEGDPTVTLISMNPTMAPEPGTWAMLMLGWGLLIFAHKRRKRA